MKALIKVGYSCNEHCTFCHTQDLRHIDGSQAEVDAKIDRAAQLGHSMVVLSGGEATIRPELFRWAARVAALDMDFGLVTNGLVLAYDEVLERLLALRLKYVYMSLHAGEARVHNSLVRRQSYETAIKALRNLSGRGLDLTINCVVTTRNMDHLNGLVDAVLPFTDANLKFSMVEPKGGAYHELDRVVPRVSDAAARVAAALEYGLAHTSGAGPRLTHGGFPLCLLPGHEARFDDLRTHRFWTMVEIGEPDFFPVDDANKVAPEQSCRRCSLRGACPGLFRPYHDRFGAAELRPPSGIPRSNAFDYTYEGAVPPDANGCPILADGVTPWDRGRHLFVRNDGKIGRFRADTRDFADAEIEAIKFGRGQVYLDASRKPAPDDFPRDLVKLERSAMCTGCGAYDECTGMFEPRFEDVFTRDDDAVRGMLGGLEGDVLDLGCGEGRYADVINARVAAGEIRYVGYDPDPAAVEAARRALPGAVVRCGTAQDLEAQGAFDHALVLRSWNHLPDPGAAMSALWEALRPGGTLTVVDNVAFALARTPAQTARARASDARFEHFRNDDAADAHDLIAQQGFELRERVEVDPGTSNQWVLRYSRPHAAR